jgi:4a-hydroxytetrahydrobiopterin dehydratase
MARTALDDTEISRRMSDVPRWTLAGAKLQRRFEFRDFVTAFGWMASVALVAEKMDHHPDWKNVYRTVDVELSTHDANGLTHNDFDLARAMDRLAAPLLGG